MIKKRVAIVLPYILNLSLGGGLVSVASFIRSFCNASNRYTPEFISVASSNNDQNSVRLLHPKSWFQGLSVSEYSWLGTFARHVGSNLPEFEFQRYMPRRKLTDLLNEYDLVQVVSGSPALAYLTHSLNTPTCLFMATLVSLEKKPILRTATLPRKIYGNIMLPIVSNLEKRALHSADHIFAETEYTRQAIPSDVDTSKVTIDTIGVDIEKFSPLSDRERTDDFLLSVGRFDDPRKNVRLLLEAYALVRQSLPNAPGLILAGKTAPAPDVWSKARDLGLADCVVVKEGLTDKELVALYQNAKLFILASNEEGLGIVLLEAMACATPVISTRCGGPNSVVVNGTGFLTPVGDAKAMAEQMLWMLQHPQHLREMGWAGRQMVESRFSYEIIAQKYLTVYDNLLRRQEP